MCSAPVAFERHLSAHRRGCKKRSVRYMVSQFGNPRAHLLGLLRMRIYTCDSLHRTYVNKYVGVLASTATCAANAASIDFVLPISRGMYSPFHRTGAAAYFNLTDCRWRSDGEWSWRSLRPFSAIERISSRQSGEQTRKLFDG